MEGIPMDKRTSEIIQQIRQVAAKTGLQGKHKALAEELNKRGIMSSRGAKWSAQGLANICNRHDLFKGKQEPPPVAPTPRAASLEEQAEPEERGRKPQATPDTPRPKLLEPESLQLDVDTIATLREIVA